MHYTDGTKNHDITVVVRADGLDCPALRPSTAGSDSQCWIAVKSGQTLSVFCDVKLAATQYQLDLVIDGVLRNIVVSTVCPRNEDRGEIVEFFEGNHKYARSLFRSPMITSRVQEQTPPIGYNNSDNTRVGTIEILIYKYDMGYNHTRAAELPENVVDWEDLEGQPGHAGVEPTHEVVMDLNNGKRLNDTERRTWKNKSEKLPMGHAPWATFKFLYRHEDALEAAQLIDPHLNIVPSARGMSSLRAGLLSFSNASPNQSPTAYARFNGNPWVVRERNGLREYKQLDITPDNPGPQISHKRRPRKKRANAGKGKKRARRPNDDTDSDVEEGSSIETPSKPSKRLRTNVGSLRKEIVQLQIKRDEARRNLEEQSTAGALELDNEQERALLTAQKEALEREIAYIDLEAANYVERHANMEEQNKATEAGNADEDAIMIDPALEEAFPSGSVAGSLSELSNGSIFVGSSDGSFSESSVAKSSADDGDAAEYSSATPESNAAKATAIVQGKSAKQAAKNSKNVQDAVAFEPDTDTVSATVDQDGTDKAGTIVNGRRTAASASSDL